MSSATHWIKGHKSQIKLLLNAFNCPYLLFANPVVRWSVNMCFFIPRFTIERRMHVFVLCLRMQKLDEGARNGDNKAQMSQGWLQNSPKVPLTTSPRSNQHLSLSLSLCVPVCVDMWVFHNQLITSLCSSGLITEERFDKSSVHVSKNKEFTANQHFM